MLVALALACASGERSVEVVPREPEAPPEASSPPRTSDSTLVASLLDLAGSALEKRDLALAEDRYRRILAVEPSSVAARTGLAEVARLRGDAEGQRAQLAAALAIDPGASDALGRLALLEAEAGRRDEARVMLERALERDPLDPVLLESLAAVSGPAPPLAGLGPEEILAAAVHHPLDPRARLAAARVLLERGDPEGARSQLVSSYWLADISPAAARRSLALLASIDPAFAKRRIVEVHVFADDSLRRRAGWRMRLRVEWLKLTHSLDPALQTIFIPISIRAFSSAGSSADLPSIRNAWLSRLEGLPRRGIVAAFTERSPPTRRGVSRLGEAELLGRIMIVRFEPEPEQSRVLLHEVIHLYGGVHVAHDLESLMNPSGGSLSLDPVNQGIVQATRVRRFGSGGPRVNLFPYVDTSKLIDVYTRALRANLALRNAGLEKARDASKESRYLARDLAGTALEMDRELAQLSQMISEFLARDQFFARAAEYSELAARLHGGRGPEARRSLARAKLLESHARAIYQKQGEAAAP